jgi:hypothetical protein
MVPIFDRAAYAAVRSLEVRLSAKPFSLPDRPVIGDSAAAKGNDRPRTFRWRPLAAPSIHVERDNSGAGLVRAPATSGLFAGRSECRRSARAHPRDLRCRRAARSILPARLAGAARGVAFGPTRSRLACVTGGAWRHARLRARSRRRRFDRRSHGRRVHAKQHAANDEALLVTAAFDMRFGHSRDANEVSAALLRLVPESGKRAVVRALGPVETAPATIRGLDRSEAFRTRRGVTLPDVDRFGAPCDRRRLRLAGDQQSDERHDPAGTHAPQSTHRGGLSPMPSSASRRRQRPTRHSNLDALRWPSRSGSFGCDKSTCTCGLPSSRTDGYLTVRPCRTGRARHRGSDWTRGSL